METTRAIQKHVPARTLNLISARPKLSSVLTRPLTRDQAASAKMLWASILAVGIALEGTVGAFAFVTLKTLLEHGHYFSFLTSLLYSLQAGALIAVGIVPQLLHGIRAALARDASPPEVPISQLPTITIQIPIRNEPFEVVSNRSLASALAIREKYPKGKLNIQIVDNSDPGKYEEIMSYCRRIEVDFIHREGKEGGKSHNLNLGLEHISTDYVFVMDADIKLEDDAINKIMGEFVENPELSFCVIEAITKNLEGKKHIFAQRMENNHNLSSFIVQIMDEFGLTPLAGYSTAINVSHLKEAGGWSETHVGEDYEMGIRLGVRLGARGKRVSYTRAEDPALIDIDRWRTQQYRWSFGTVQTLRDHALPFLRSSDFDWHEKISIMHKLSYYPTLAMAYVIPSILKAPLSLLAAQEGGMQYQSSLVMTAFHWLLFLTLPLSFSLKNIVQDKDVSKFWQAMKKTYGGLLINAGILLEVTKSLYSALKYKNDYFRITPKGKMDQVSLWETIKKNKWEFALGTVFVVPVILGAYVSFWTGFIGLGIFSAPLISWYSNYRTQKNG